MSRPLLEFTARGPFLGTLACGRFFFEKADWHKYDHFKVLPAQAAMSAILHCSFIFYLNRFPHFLHSLAWTAKIKKPWLISIILFISAWLTIVIYNFMKKWVWNKGMALLLIGAVPCRCRGLNTTVGWCGGDCVLARPLMWMEWSVYFILVYHTEDD